LHRSNKSALADALVPAQAGTHNPREVFCEGN